MGQFYETIPQNIYEWILTQKMLWVATAPLSAAHHVNVSPKGGEYFGLIDNKTFWLHELSGSGSETIAHLRENGRITIMFNAFDGSPRIVRLWGHGKILERGSSKFDSFVAENHIETIPATRSIILVDIHQVGSSCGYSVPFYEFKGFRKTLNQVFEKREKDLQNGDADKTMKRYWAYKNAWSVDGLPAMQQGLETGALEKVEPITKMTGPFAPANPHGRDTNKVVAQLRFYTARLMRVQLDLVTVILIALTTFLLGSIAPAYLYGLKRIVETQLSQIAI